MPAISVDPRGRFMFSPQLELGARTRRLSRAGAVLAIAAALAGCGSTFSGAGPYKGSITSMAEGDTPPYTLIQLGPQTIAPYMRPPAPVLKSSVSDMPVPSVRLVPGDVMRIVISDSAVEGALFAPLSAGGTVFDSVRVSGSGKISLPYVNEIKVSGLTLSQVEANIRKRLAGVAADPQVHVALVGDMSGSVLVAGAVKAPGRFSALQGPLTLLDAINQAGGPTLEPHLVTVVMRTGKAVQQFSYEDLLAGRNMPVPPHSEIVLERARKRFVAMGAVNAPGLHDLPSQSPSLLEVLGTVGGLNERSADPRGVFVFRLNEAAKPGEPAAQVFQLDMRDPTAMFLARQFLVQPEDAVYVTNAAIYEAQKIISPIVQVLVLGRTLDRGL
ncbi:polysaccharide biosynthesis/export family protein [Bordetella sp. 2513F-2]